MTPDYILRKSLCRTPAEIRHRPEDVRATYLRDAESEICNMGYTTEYGEPGYDNPKRGILFANWNYFCRDACDLLERAGYAMEWSDEWTVNFDGDMKAYRTQPDSYNWTPSLIYLDDGTSIARDEVDNGDCFDLYLAYLIDRPDHCDTFRFDWSKHGFDRLSESGRFESGWPWQTDDPEKVLAEYQTLYPGKEFLFQIDSKGQFDTGFSIWGRDKQMREYQLKTLKEDL